MITLTLEERQRFIAFCRQESETNKGLGVEMNKLKGNEVMVKRMNAKSVCYKIIAEDLDRLVEVTIE